MMRQLMANDGATNKLALRRVTAKVCTSKKRPMQSSRCLVWVLLLICHGSTRNSAHAFSFIVSKPSSHKLQSSNSKSNIRPIAPPNQFDRTLSWCTERMTDLEQQPDIHPTQSQSTTASLPTLYPHFARILKENGFTTPTPIQKSSYPRAKNGENLLLIAATGSGKTLAYLLPSLPRTLHPHPNPNDTPTKKTCLVVAPTRELAAQLARDASLLLPHDPRSASFPPVLLAVRGIPPPAPSLLAHAAVLVGTPHELHAVLTRIGGASRFVSGDALSTVVLDEVDVLLPSSPKTLRTAFDASRGGADDDRRRRDEWNRERRRKVRAAQRRGVEFRGGSDVRGKASVDFSEGAEVLTPTERILRLVASARFVGGEERMGLQLLAGSATASRSTLDRLNRALRCASSEGGVIGMGETMDAVWRGDVKVCRAEADDGDLTEAEEKNNAFDVASRESSHTIRAVTVPSVVEHRYVAMPKESVTNAHEILSRVALVIRRLQPQTSLVFICGEFSRSIAKEKKKEAPNVKGKTSQARRDAKRTRLFIERLKEDTEQGEKSGLPEPLSVRSACSILQSMGIDAQPMHVALGLEPNANDVMDGSFGDGSINEVELPPVLVTFEGSARGLHFDGVDIVFVVGRPTSAASYLHLAGRVGRAIPKLDADMNNHKVEVRPGVIVSFCSKGRVAELDKWTKQVGGTELKEII
ncbi:hypothetical protein ACHAWX_006042 [Stephanocyclus meneghinianus]